MNKQIRKLIEQDRERPEPEHLTPAPLPKAMSESEWCTWSDSEWAKLEAAGDALELHKLDNPVAERYVKLTAHEKKLQDKLGEAEAELLSEAAAESALHHRGLRYDESPQYAAPIITLPKGTF